MVLPLLCRIESATIYRNKSPGYDLGLSIEAMVASSDPLTQALKVCSQCNKSLPTHRFNTRANVPGGLRSECKDCQRKYRYRYTSQLTAENRKQSNKRGQTRNKQNNQNIHKALGKHLIYYIANPTDPSLIKIGHSSSMHTRMTSLLCAIPRVHLLALVQVQDKDKETDLHWQFSPFRYEGEWFLAKAPLLQHLSSLNQSLAQQCIPLLIPAQQSRVTVPPLTQFIDSAPFLGL